MFNITKKSSHPEAKCQRPRIWPAKCVCVVSRDYCLVLTYFLSCKGVGGSNLGCRRLDVSERGVRSSKTGRRCGNEDWTKRRRQKRADAMHGVAKITNYDHTYVHACLVGSQKSSCCTLFLVSLMLQCYACLDIKVFYHTEVPTISSCRACFAVQWKPIVSGSAMCIVRPCNNCKIAFASRSFVVAMHKS